jgi:hypothetical protein
MNERSCSGPFRIKVFWLRVIFLRVVDGVHGHSDNHARLDVNPVVGYVFVAFTFQSKWNDFNEWLVYVMNFSSDLPGQSWIQAKSFIDHLFKLGEIRDHFVAHISLNELNSAKYERFASFMKILTYCSIFSTAKWCNLSCTSGFRANRKQMWLVCTGCRVVASDQEHARLN